MAVENPTVEAEDIPQPSAAKKLPIDKLKGRAGAFWSFLDYIAFGRFLHEEINYTQVRVNEADFFPKHRRMLRLLRRQLYVIIALVLLIIAGAPYVQPLYTYQARIPGTEKKVMSLTGMSEPNLTDHAILSWVATSITEILTFGFGDFDQRIFAQRPRFTDLGWQSFLKSIRDQNMRAEFKSRQLVLTTAPSEAPVIASKGKDKDEDYVWEVQMPIVMTYTTNNNVRRGDNKLVILTIARVPSSQNVRGLGIKRWIMK